MTLDTVIWLPALGYSAITDMRRPDHPPSQPLAAFTGTQDGASCGERKTAVLGLPALFSTIYIVPNLPQPCIFSTRRLLVVKGMVVGRLMFLHELFKLASFPWPRLWAHQQTSTYQHRQPIFLQLGHDGLFSPRFLCELLIMLLELLHHPAFPGFLSHTYKGLVFELLHVKRGQECQNTQRTLPVILKISVRQFLQQYDDSPPTSTDTTVFLEPKASSLPLEQHIMCFCRQMMR